MDGTCVVLDAGKGVKSERRNVKIEGPHSSLVFGRWSLAVGTCLLRLQCLALPIPVPPIRSPGVV